MSRKLSIIVPIYNSEHSLSKCIESILSQNFSDFELILVNDGSSDNSHLLCKEYSSRDGRIIYISQPNGGVSSARNAGINEASGQWITFVDSDDYIGADWLDAFYKQKDADLIIQGFQVVVNGNVISKNILAETLLKGNDILQGTYDLERMPFTPIRIPWNKFFKTSIVKENHVTFKEHIHLGEDYIFVNTYLMFCKSMLILPTCNYYYVVSDCGLARKKHSIEEVLSWHLEIFTSLKMLAVKFSSYRCYNYYRKKVYVNLTRQILKSERSIKEKKREISLLKTSHDYKRLIMVSKYFYLAILPFNLIAYMHR